MNKKIKIIDLFFKIANGEKVKEFIYKGYIYQRHDCGYYRSVINSNWVGFHTDFDICSKEILNDYAILEDNTEEIEELGDDNFYNCANPKDIKKLFEIYENKINELVKAVNQIRKEKE